MTEIPIYIIKRNNSTIQRVSFQFVYLIVTCKDDKRGTPPYTLTKIYNNSI